MTHSIRLPESVPDASSPKAAFADLEPALLTARELVAEARAAVAKSQELIAHGRKLRQQSELIRKRFQKSSYTRPAESAPQGRLVHAGAQAGSDR